MAVVVDPGVLDRLAVDEVRRRVHSDLAQRPQDRDDAPVALGVQVVDAASVGLLQAAVDDGVAQLRRELGESSRVHGESREGPKWSSMWAIPPWPPARWKVSSGPWIGQRSPGPSVMERSICSTVASPLATMCRASRHSASCSRLAMNPGTSRSIVMTDLPRG